MQNIYWTRVYEQEAGALLGVAYRYVKDRKQAEDIVQNAFITAIQKAETFKGTGAFEAWLRRIVVNESLMFLRAKNPIYTGLNERTEAIPDESVQTDYVNEYQVIQHADFSQDDLLQTANLLPEHHRLVFYLYVVDGYSHKDIAQHLNISEGTSKSHLNRARKKLQELLYQKALAMKKHQKKSLFIFALFSTLFVKANPIDKLYRGAFANYALPVPPMPSGVEMAGSSVSVGLSAGAITGIATAVGGSALVVGTLTYQALNTDDSTPIDIDTSPTEMAYPQPETPVWIEDSTDSPPQIKPILKEENPLEETPEIKDEEPEPPVFIKQTTVIIDTADEE